MEVNRMSRHMVVRFRTVYGMTILDLSQLSGTHYTPIKSCGFPPPQGPVKRVLEQQILLHLLMLAVKEVAFFYWVYETDVKEDARIHFDFFMAFLNKLIHDTSQKFYLVMDNVRVNQAKVSITWLADKKDRIELVILPP